MRTLAPTALAGCLLLTPAAATASATPATPGAPARSDAARPATASDELARVATTDFTVTSVAAASESTIWLAGVDANQHVVVQRATTSRKAGAKVRLHPAVTLEAIAPKGVQISAVDDEEAWLVTAPLPEKRMRDRSEPYQRSADLWRYSGGRWAKVAVSLAGGGAPGSAWEVRDLPGRRSALVNTIGQIWRYTRKGFVNATTSIYAEPYLDGGIPTDFSYGMRPSGTGFVAMGRTPMTINFLRGRDGTVSWVGNVGGESLGGEAWPDAWQTLPDGSTIAMERLVQYEANYNIISQQCLHWSATDESALCAAPPAIVETLAVLGDGSLLLGATDRLWHRANPTAPDVAVTGDIGGGIVAMDAARGSRVAWVAAKTAAGGGSTLSRYVAR